jgi:heme A synthase
VLIVAGALVTSNDAGLSVPDWPTTFGSIYKMPHMVGGVKFEHGHRMVAEFVGLLTIVIAVWTWRAEKRRWMRVLGVAALGTVVLYVQLILGAMFRHKGLSWWPHVVHAGIVAIVLSWTSIRALTQYSRIEAVRTPAITMLYLMIAQLCLGFTAFLTRVAWGKDALQPESPMVLSTVAHVAVGALLLATAVVLAIQVWRHVPVAFEAPIRSGERSPIAA